MNPFERFLTALDEAWDQAGDRIRLPVFGCGALLLQTDYDRMTKDGDIFEIAEHTPRIKARLLELAGKNTPLHRQHRMYVEIVPNGIPFLPHVPLWMPRNLPLRWFAIEALDVVDVVVSKLARFSADDRYDIDQMIKRGLVPHAKLLARFRDAVDERSTDARADQLPQYIKRFHVVERDMLHVEESEIELPSWL